MKISICRQNSRLDVMTVVTAPMLPRNKHVAKLSYSLQFVSFLMG